MLRILLKTSVVLLITTCQPLCAAIITYNLEMDVISSSPDILGVTAPTGTITGTLTYDNEAVPNGNVANLPNQGVWTDVLGPTSELSLDLGGGIISTVPGELDSLAINFGGSYVLAFGVQIDGNANITSAPNSILLDGNPIANSASVIVGFSTDINPQSADTLDFSLLPDSQWEGSLVFGSFDQLSLAIGGINGGSLIANNIRVVSVQDTTLVPEPGSFLVWTLCLASSLILRNWRTQER